MPEYFDPLTEFASQSFDDHWDDARIPECVEYIRGNCSLFIPREWRDHFRV